MAMGVDTDGGCTTGSFLGLKIFFDMDLPRGGELSTFEIEEPELELI